MGNICSGGSEEKKANALDDRDIPNNITDDTPVATADSLSPSVPKLTPAEQLHDLEQNRLLRKEQARQDLIVQTAGRSMVPVRNTRGSSYLYNDQGFGAALAQHLQDTLHVDTRNPPLPNDQRPTKILDRFATPMWQNIQLGSKGTGLAGCDGENPHNVMDHIAVSYLHTAPVKKEQILHEVLPMVASLL